MAVLDLAAYKNKGHVTVPAVFTAVEMDAAIEDIERWGEEFLRELPASQRRWYLDGGVKAKEVLRKLDNPHHHRESMRRIARDPRLVALVESAIDAELLSLDSRITDCNSAFFDVAHNFACCIPGCHEVLRRQGLLEGVWCLDPKETLSPGQAAEIDRVCAEYPELNDDAFVQVNLGKWLS